MPSDKIVVAVIDYKDLTEFLQKIGKDNPTLSEPKAPAPAKKQEKLHTVKEMCDMLRVSRPTLDKLIKDGSIQATYIRGRKLISQTAFDYFINSNRI